MKNPYEKPKSNLESKSQHENKSKKRPISITLLIIFISIVLIGNIYTVLVNIKTITNVTDLSSIPISDMRNFTFNMLTIVWYSVTLFFIFKKRNVGRWLAFIFLSIFIVNSIYAGFIKPADSELNGNMHLKYNSPEFGLLVHKSFLIIFTSLTIWWAYLVGFSKKSKDYFG